MCSRDLFVGTKLLVFLTMIIQGLGFGCALSVGDRALGIYPRSSKGWWLAVYSVLQSKPLVYLTKIIQGLVASCALCVVGGALGVSD